MDPFVFRKFTVFQGNSLPYVVVDCSHSILCFFSILFRNALLGLTRMLLDLINLFVVLALHMSFPIVLFMLLSEVFESK